MKSRLQKLEELTHKKLKINIEKVVKGLNGTFRPTKIHIHTLKGADIIFMGNSLE
jgi:hypothetical protein